MSTLWRNNKIKYDLKGHIISLLCQNFFSTFVYGPILMKDYMNANIMMTQFFHKIINDLKCHSNVMIFL